MRWLRSGFDFGVRDHEMNEPKSGSYPVIAS
jgi:hypothetical protein